MAHKTKKNQKISTVRSSFTQQQKDENNKKMCNKIKQKMN